jgi:hypothetical protein
MNNVIIEDWWERYRIRSFSQQRKMMNNGISELEFTLLTTVILPSVPSLEFVMPKYRVTFPFPKLPKFIDFVCFYGGLKIGFDISFAQTVESFSDQIQVDRYLIQNGWKLLRYSEKDFGVDLTRTAEETQLYLRTLLGFNTKLSMYEREIVSYLRKNNLNLFKPTQIYDGLAIGKHKIRHTLNEMVSKQIITAVGSNSRCIHRYQLNISHPEIQKLLICH